MNTLKRLLLLVLSISIISIACKDSSNPTGDVSSGSHRVSGKVLTADNNLGIKNALITLMQNSTSNVTQSNSNGEFQFSGVKSGDYTIELKLPRGFSGYEETEKQVSVDRNVQVNFFGNPIKEIAKTIKQGVVDTLYTSSGASLTVDATEALMDIDIMIQEMDNDLSFEENLNTKPVQIWIGTTSSQEKIGFQSAQTSRNDRVRFQLQQDIDMHSDLTIFMFDIGTQDEPFITFADGRSTTINDSNTGVEISVLEYEFETSSTDESGFIFTTSSIDETCDDTYRDLKLLENGMNGSTPLILIHGIQTRNKQCNDFNNFNPWESTFSSLITELQNHPEIKETYKLYAFKYTSNTTVLENSEALWKMIQDKGLYDPVIVAHSMGGLVARGLMKEYGDDKISGLITLGTPHEGSPMVELLTDEDLRKQVREKLCPGYIGTGCAAIILGASIPNTPGLRDLKTDSPLIEMLRGQADQNYKIHTLAGYLGDLGDIGEHEGILYGRALKSTYSLGFRYMKELLDLDNDGMVPLSSAESNIFTTINSLRGNDHTEIRAVPWNSDLIFREILPHLLELSGQFFLPQLTTIEVTNVTPTTAVSGANISNDGGTAIIEKGICWNTLQNPSIEDTCNFHGEGTGRFTSELSDLFPETTYYVRAFATNSVGTAYGNQNTFKTKKGINDVPPGVNDFLTPEEVETLINDGLKVYKGLDPPNIEGNYYMNSLEELNGNMRFINYSYKFTNQTSDLRIEAYHQSDNGTDVGEGLGAFIAGSGQTFSVYLETKSEIRDGGHTVFINSASIYSGIKTSEGIENFQFGFIITHKENDRNNRFMNVGDTRIVYEADGLAEEVPDYPYTPSKSKYFERNYIYSNNRP